MKVIIEIDDNEVLVALRRIDDYEDAHPELLVEDAKIQWPDYRIVAIHRPGGSGDEWREG